MSETPGATDRGDAITTTTTNDEVTQEASEEQATGAPAAAVAATDASQDNVNVTWQGEQGQAGAPIAAPGEGYPFNMEDPNSTTGAATTTAEQPQQQVVAPPPDSTTAATAASSVACTPVPAPATTLETTDTTTASIASGPTLVCRICGKGQDDDNDATRKRLLVRFLPVESLPDASLDTWDQDIVLHVFCGKTASILPTVNQPDLEILSKAGVKNKHGIGPEVNAALARTRCAVLVNQHESTREKEFFLIKEFEAHLQAIRAVHASHHHHHETAASVPVYYHHRHAAAAAPFHSLQATSTTTTEKELPHKVGQSYVKSSMSRRTPATEDSHHDWALHQAVAAATGADELLPSSSQQQHFASTQQEEEDDDGKIRCGCGGTHFSPGTPRGAASWRAHVMTKRHQKWMEDNGMLGAV